MESSLLQNVLYQHGGMPSKVREQKTGKQERKQGRIG